MLYYHFRTGHSINFYLPGYGAYWTEEEYPDGKVVAEIATVNGMRLFNEGGQEIGRFEYYYGQRGNMGNRYISNQPLLQRWVVSKDAISKARCIVGCPNNIKINHAFDSVIRKYED